MYRTKKDVDKYVESLLSKISVKEFQTRAYSVGRLYFEVGDYASCQIYVEQYLQNKENNAAAHKLLGHALHKLGQKEKALEQFKASLDIDPTQTSLVLDICELLIDDEINIDAARAKYWCEKAEAIFPKHPITFRLCEKLISMTNPDPEALIKLLSSELKSRPKDASLHSRLLKHYLEANKIKEAFDHSFNVEFDNNPFINNYAWYETVSELLKHNSLNKNNWEYKLLLLTVRERICLLSLAETPSGTSKSLIESNELLHLYDQTLCSVEQEGPIPNHAEFHSYLLNHHKGQFALHTATFMLKKAKKDQLSWRDANRYAAPLMLSAWHAIPFDPNVKWLSHAPEKQKSAAKRWYIEGTYRYSQSGHYLLTNFKDKSQFFLDQVSQLCSGSQWKEKVYEKLFSSQECLSKKKSSYICSNSFNSPTLRLPRKAEVEAYDTDSPRAYPNSLHHFVWILLNYKDYTCFKCTVFDMLTPKTFNFANCGPETLNKLDVFAFLYCAALTAQEEKSSQFSFVTNEKPVILPCNITDLLCTLQQMKWWDCAYKFCQNELGTELTDIRATLSRGIEVVRCVDNHGLDPVLLCTLGRIFSELAKTSSEVNEKINLETRANLYYTSAISLLEKLKSRIFVKIPEKRMFNYTHKELDSKDLNSLLEESKLYVSNIYLNNGDYERVIEILSGLNTPQAYYYLSETYKRKSYEDSNLSKDSDEDKSKQATLLFKAKSLAYRALDKLKDTESNKHDPFYIKVQELIEGIETNLNNIDSDLILNNSNNVGNYSSHENMSIALEHLPAPISKSHFFGKLSSTPKQSHNTNLTNYRTANETEILDSTRVDQQFLERIENQIKNLQKRDTTINDFMEQTKDWFDENRKLGNLIINTIHSNIQNTNDQFKLLRTSVDQVKDQIDECRNECKDVGDLKKQVAELKIEVSKLKKVSSEQAINESDLYNLEEDFRQNDSTSNFNTQLPFAPTQMIPPFNQRLVPPFQVPPNPYLYSQNLYNLYNQYSQLVQPPTVAAAPPIFDPNRQMNYAGVYPTPDQLYLDVANLVPQSTPVAPNLQSVPTVPLAPTVHVPPVTAPPPSSLPNIVKFNATEKSKEQSKQLPVNVVITSSDPLPTCTTGPAPVLSVTIPSKHIKGIPHNYQIPMPSTSDTKVIPPPIFSFSTTTTNKTNPVTTSTNWSKPALFQTSNNNTKHADIVHDTLDGSTISHTSSQNNSLNKSRTLSERSNTSVENYDPCPDFKPIIPLPDEIKVTTGEENETVIFSSRAKLFRFVDKQWKERGLGEMKLLKHNTTGKVRVLMRREQIHKICANHIITQEMDIQPMKNETKAYFWVANDFADETVILEKFCIRFKTAEIASQFYETFEKARKDSTASQKDNSNKPQLKTDITFIKPHIEEPNTGKTILGGFTFSSTPTIKSVIDKTITEKTGEPATNKVNLFSNVVFKTTNSSFNTLFNTPNESRNTIQDGNSDIDQNKCNVSNDTVEEFEPNIEFKPVVPLPALVDQKTGEEDEIILFEYRAKLLRFETSNKEWKERGLGQIKLLAHKDNSQRVRLLMRREQVMKVCCNHALTKDMLFQKMPNVDKAVTWCAKDFSEGELVPETFCLRFKTSEKCDQFLIAIKTAQSKMKDDTKTEKEKQNAAKQTNQGFGDKFRPKPGSWECNDCFLRNDCSVDHCSACNAPRDPSIVKKDVKPTIANSMQFSFGIPTNLPSKPIVSGWGDKFKPKEGSWECKECFIRNESNVENCSACSNPKDPSAVKTECKSQILSNMASGPKFNFGIPTNSSVNQKSVPSKTTSIFDGTGVHKFNFGISPNVQNSYEDPNSISKSVFETTPANDKEPNYWNLHKSEINTPVKPALLPTPQKDSSSNILGSKEAGSFGFVFTPKTQTKGKSPIKSPTSEKGEESDCNEYASEDEGHHIHFNPVIPLPDKVDVVTGEENEVELYGHRAKLFRFMSGEWKERGIGVVKILKHKDTDKLRVVMRREQVLKICLNHSLNQEIIYTLKDDKTWLFAANDYSEGELSLQQFCLRFKSKDIALQFKDAIDKAREKKVNKSSGSQNEDVNDVVFIKEIQASTEDKKKAKALMLPENFFTYKDKQPCQGCRGCDCDSDQNSNSRPANIFQSLVASTSVFPSTPKSTSILQSSTSSIYGTPFNVNTSDLSIFRTPRISDMKSFFTPSSSEDDEKNKNEEKVDEENYDYSQIRPGSSVTDSTSHISKSSILAAPKLSSICAKPGADTKSAVGFTTEKFGDDETRPVRPVFGQTNLGLSFNKAIFASTGNKSSNQNVEVKSIFGGELTQKPLNLFGDSKKGSIFGPNALKFNQKSETSDSQLKSDSKAEIDTKVLDSSNDNSLAVTKQDVTTDSQIPETKTPFSFDNSSTFAALSATSSDFGRQLFGQTNSSLSVNKSIFGSGNEPGNQNIPVKSIFAGDFTQKPLNLFSDSKPGSMFGPNALNFNRKSEELDSQKNLNAGLNSEVLDSSSENSRAEIKHETKTDSQNSENKTPLSVENSLTFAALSATSTDFGLQKKPGFKWEGAGEQLFVGPPQSLDKSGCTDTSTGADEEYDPHYEPIVPMPDKIVVTTGEEDEEKVYGERCKLYRYVEQNREWKERGVGEMKILYHPSKKTYRMLLRREQVHKAVLNMLLFNDLELLSMKNSDKAWTWAGRNYAESPSGEQETLAVRFKTNTLAEAFKSKVDECVRKLQAFTAEALREEEASKSFENVTLLRLPKHLENSARADENILAHSQQHLSSMTENVKESADKEKQNGEVSETVNIRQVQFQEPQEEPEQDDEDEDEYNDHYEHYDDQNESYEDYPEDDDSGLYYACNGQAIVSQDNTKITCDEANIQVMFDADTCSPKILIADNNTGEILADMLIHTETQFHMIENSCTWSGTDFTSNDPVEKSVTLNFYNSDMALQFYDSCETSKAATYSSTDPES